MLSSPASFPESFQHFSTRGGNAPRRAARSAGGPRQRPAGPPSSLRKCSPGMAKSHLNLGKNSFRWTPGQPPKMATVSQFEAPQGRRDVDRIW
eukprot:8979045-Pyramimonas_sp.AAC.1